MSDKKSSGGMVLYPLVYSIDGDDFDKSNVICKGIDGKIYKFNLNPPAAAREKAKVDTAATIPKLSKFAETHRKAVNPCFASMDNGRENPNGIFVGEQIVYKGSENIDLGGVKVEATIIEGSWASVIRDSREGYRAPIGYGYLETNFNTKMNPQGNEYLMRYKEITEQLDNPDQYPGIDMIELTAEQARLSGMIRSQRQKWFVGVLIHIQQMITVTPEDIVNMRGYVSNFLQRYTKNGIYGGVMIRPHKDGTVITSLCKTYEHRYDYRKGVVADIEDVLDDFMKYYGNKLSRDVKAKGYQVDIVPLERFNCGSPGNDKYSKDVNGHSSKVMKTFVEKSLQEDPVVNIKAKCGFLYSKVAMRLAQTVDGSSMLLSSIHAFSKPIGSILTIDKKGEPSMKLDNKLVTDPEPVV